MDLPDEAMFKRMVGKFIREQLPKGMDDVEKLLNKNRIFVDRTKGVGAVSRDEAIAWSLTGPTLRALNSKIAVDGGDPKIVALSTSWGTCESEFSDRFAFRHDTVKAVGNILKSLTAAGVTIFAASGDDGIYDCGDAPSSTKAATRALS